MRGARTEIIAMRATRRKARLRGRIFRVTMPRKSWYVKNEQALPCEHKTTKKSAMKTRLILSKDSGLVSATESIIDLFHDDYRRRRRTAATCPACPPAPPRSLSHRIATLLSPSPPRSASAAVAA